MNFLTWWFSMLPKPPEPVEPNHGVPTEIEEALWKQGWLHGYASGQISGRKQLLGEIEMKLAARCRGNEEYNEDDLEADQYRLLH